MSESLKTDTPWLRLGDLMVTSRDVLLDVKLGWSDDMRRRLAYRKHAAAQALAQGLAPSDEDLDRELEVFWAERELYEDPAIAAWLQQRRLTRGELREALRQRLLVEHYLGALASEDAIRERFLADRAAHARGWFEVLTCQAEGLAQEIMDAVRREIRPWPGGEMRAMWRAEAPEALAETLFETPAGGLAGPLALAEDRVEIWRVVKLQPPELDADTRARIANELLLEDRRRALGEDEPEFLA